MADLLVFASTNGFLTYPYPPKSLVIRDILGTDNQRIMTLGYIRLLADFRGKYFFANWLAKISSHIHCLNVLKISALYNKVGNTTG
jgi:hypothetical protein